MKVAIPSETGEGLTSVRSGHFGHTPWFTIATIENDEVVKVESVKNVDHDQVGCGGVIEFAHSLGIDAMITAGMGAPGRSCASRSTAWRCTLSSKRRSWATC